MSWAISGLVEDESMAMAEKQSSRGKWTLCLMWSCTLGTLTTYSRHIETGLLGFLQFFGPSKVTSMFSLRLFVLGGFKRTLICHFLFLNYLHLFICSWVL